MNNFLNNSTLLPTSVVRFIEHDISRGFLRDWSLNNIFKGFGHLFYVVNPDDTTFKDAEEVPDFFTNAWPFFLLFILIENVVLWCQQKPIYRLNDGITSLSHGLIQQCGRFIFRGSETYMYFYIYHNHRVFNLAWDHPFTWYIAAIGVDFCYYWVHRACHEVHILWAQHQVHHSSEDYNLAVGLRQSILQEWCGFAFYLPLAFFIPPSHFLTHQQFNLLFQFWIHTDTINTIGPLEYIFNSPQHHRVHHGSNIYCLDKNYGGVLIIWDRLFGTYAEEKKGEEIIYGLVFNQPSFNPLHLQTFYSWYVVQKFRQMKGWRHKLAAIFYGPSWVPGEPRTGLEANKVKVTKRMKYDVKLSFWYNIYLFIHFCMIVFGFNELTSRNMGLTPLTIFLSVIYIIGSLTSIGMIFDNHQWSSVIEAVRCLLFVIVVQRTSVLDSNNIFLSAIEMFFIVSGIFWFLKSVSVLQIYSYKLINSKKKE